MPNWEAIETDVRIISECIESMNELILSNGKLLRGLTTNYLEIKSQIFNLESELKRQKIKNEGLEKRMGILTRNLTIGE